MDLPALASVLSWLEIGAAALTLAAALVWAIAEGSALPPRSGTE